MRSNGRAFHAPLLSERRNIVVIADEAHRSQYDLIDGLARNLRDSLPHASREGRRMNVEGRKLGDKATVPIYHESRVAKLGPRKSEGRRKK